jgi:hypothetical protein
MFGPLPTLQASGRFAAWNSPRLLRRVGLEPHGTKVERAIRNGLTNHWSKGYPTRVHLRMITTVSIESMLGVVGSCSGSSRSAKL